MDDSDEYYESLHRAITTLRPQLDRLAIDDPRRYLVYQQLLWCYHQAFVLSRWRIAAYRAARRNIP
jgi:hypothetical protein